MGKARCFLNSLWNGDTLIHPEKQGSANKNRLTDRASQLAEFSTEAHI